MDTTIQRLKDRVDETRTAERDWEGFELLAAACSYCCTQYTGGNKDCPPKPLAE